MSAYPKTSEAQRYDSSEQASERSGKPVLG